MFNGKNLKIVRNLKQEISSRLRWLGFSGNSQKSSVDYIKMISGVNELQSSDAEKKLEQMVRSQLKSEFPGIENKKSYEFLVDAVIHNYKKKELKAQDELLK